MVASLVKKRINLSVYFDSVVWEFKKYIPDSSLTRGPYASRLQRTRDSGAGSRDSGLGSRDSESGGTRLGSY